eukprot:732593-Pyramimonas_sp.AAC.1
MVSVSRFPDHPGDHTYTVELYKMTMDTLQHEGDIGEMTRGIYTHHKRCALSNPDATIKEATLKKCPTLRAIVYLESTGVTIEQEGGDDGTNNEEEVLELRTAIFEGAEQLRRCSHAYTSGPGIILKELGLHNMEDFVSYDGTRLLTLPEMRVRHAGKRFGPEHGEAIRALRRNLGCEGDGTLPTTHRVEPRKGPLETGLHNATTHEPNT